MFKEKFKGEGRAEVGPMTLTKVVKGMCGRRLKPDELLYDLASKIYYIVVIYQTLVMGC